MAGMLLVLFALACRPTSRTTSVQGIALPDLLSVATGALLVLAALLQFARQRVSGVTSALWHGIVPLLAALTVVARRVVPSTRIGLDESLVGAFALAAAVALLLSGLVCAVGSEIDARQRRGAVIGALVAVVAGLTVAFHASGLEYRNTLDPAPGVEARLALAAGGALVGALLVHRSTRLRSTSSAWLALFAFGFGAAEAVAALHFDQGFSTSTSRGLLLTLAAAAYVYGSESDLGEALARQATELDHTRAEYVAADGRSRDAHAAAAERAHEARNALAAISGAIKTLERYHDRLPVDTRTSLAAGMSDELIRLQRLVDVDERLADPTLFRLCDVLMPVVVLARNQGLDVEADLRPDIEVIAVRDATVQVVQNLLVNAERHGGGIGVVVQVGTDGERALIRVLDRGPGVPDELKDVIFRRGLRASEAEGRGFGLYLGRRLVEAQGGTLTVADRRGGGAKFEFDLPLAPSCRRMWAPPVDHGQVVPDAQDAGAR